MNKFQSQFPHRGEIYQVYFYPKRGQEISKLRPALVISNNLQNEHDSHIIIAPLSSKVSKIRPFEVLIAVTPETGLEKPSKVLTSRLRAIDKKLRLRDYVGIASKEIIEQVKTALKTVLILD